jgi:DNA polymerase-4
MTGCVPPGKGKAVAEEIGNRVKKDTGLTVSIGVSWNKVFAKLGSDYKKPDAVTVIDRGRYKDMVWPLPVENLLYVGPSTSRKLRGMGIDTIGCLAAADPETLRLRLGKMGLVIHSFANGLDNSPVVREDLAPPVKSIGNSTTTPRDLVNDREAWVTLAALAESVGMRLRENGFMCRTVEVSVRDDSLNWRSRQLKLPYATDITREIADISFRLFKSLHMWPAPVRSLGIRCTDLVPVSFPEQLSLFSDYEKRDRQRQLDRVMDDIRRKHGFGIIKRAAVLENGGADVLHKGAGSLPGAL